ncbi:MAG: hypothetical protein Q7J25_12685 [Vicinamibacterales bacterium]|nr:hypothetical protein [Vicinamibacterales bacterium]
MSTKENVRDPHAFRPDEVVLANIERTARRVESVSDIDVEAIVRSSVTAYLGARKTEIEAVRVYVPIFQRALAVLDAMPGQWLWKEFWSDAASVGIAVSVFMASMVSFLDMRAVADTIVPVLRSSSFRIESVIIVLSGIVICFLLYRSDRFQRSTGAFAAALVGCGLVWGVAQSTGLSTGSSALRSIASFQLEQAALNLMVGREKTGRFDRLDVTGETFMLATEQTSSQRAVYYATATGVRGRIVADLGPSSGTVKWSDSSGEDVTRLFKGKVVDTPAAGLVIDDGSGKSFLIKRGTAVFPQVSVGNYVMGAYDQSTHEASVVMLWPSKNPS